MEKSIPAITKLLPTESIDNLLSQILKSKEWAQAGTDVLLHAGLNTAIIQ